MRAVVGKLILLALMSPLSLSASADDRVDKLPEKERKWLTEEVPYIITNVEREAFLSLQSEQERDAFVEAFWRKRDENPATLDNEYRDEHYKRLEYANEFFGRDTFRKGWQTDRGRYYILLGPPRNRQTFENDAVYPTELWFYDNSDLKQYGLPPFFYLLFFRRFGAGELEIYSPVLDGPQALLTGPDTKSADFREDVERAYTKLNEVDPELAQASLSFRTDEGDTAQFQAVSFGTVALMDQIKDVPFHNLDTGYAERLDFERGNVESDYLFRYVPSLGAVATLPGPDGASFVHWVIELEPESVAYVKDQETGVYGSRFVVTMEAVPRDDPDKIALQSRNESFVRLQESDTASLHRPLAYTGMVPLVPGAFHFRVILRNRACPSRDEKDCAKSYTLLDRDIDVPDWSQGSTGSTEPALTGVVLGYGKELREGVPLYRAFRFGSMELLPDPSAIYAIDETLVAAVDFRNAPADSQIRFRVVADNGAQETEDAAAALDESIPLGAQAPSPMMQELSLAGFQGGRFRLVTTLVGEGGRKLGEIATPFSVSPRTSIPRPAVRGSAPQVRTEVPGIVASTLGEQYLALDDREKARQQFELALQQNPKLGLAREHLAQLALDDGEYQKVVALLAPVYAEVKDRFEVVAPLGEAYFRQGAFEPAAELLERAVVLRRPQPAILNMLAGAQQKLGNTTRARELLEQSLALDPSQPQTKELLRSLKVDREGKS
jgi:GWxTD domain-containing protein